MVDDDNAIASGDRVVKEKVDRAVREWRLVWLAERRQRCAI